MKTHRILRLTLFALFFANGHCPLAVAQGSLTPPGAPAPTMKTLAQIEPRTPISTAPFTISASGSYYLTTNLSVTSGSAITITADDVTLDLNGFTISSTASPGSGSGVEISGSLRQNITISNGHIKGTTSYASGIFTSGGFLNGIIGLNPIRNGLVSRVSVSAVFGAGIHLLTSGSTTSVQDCMVTICGGVGISAAIVGGCVVEASDNTAISATTVQNSFGTSVSNAVNASGIFATTADNCVGTASFGRGISASTASNCRGTSTSSFGLFATTAINCTGISSTGTGLVAENASNCSGTSTAGAAGLDANPGTASFCRGKRDGGTAITATNAIGCTVNGTGTVTATNKFLGTP